MPDVLLTQLIRIPGFRRLWTKCPLGSVKTRVLFDIWNRPHYAYGVYWAAWQALRLGLPGISVIEFGVASGEGLISLEKISAEIAKELVIEIAVYGFDSGQGMPPPKDYRDMPHVWQAGQYPMDQSALRSKLRNAELIIGSIEQTARGFVPRYPIGFIAFDLDYRSSTLDALQVVETENAGYLLPRVYSYFDDVVWPEWACQCPGTGELAAMEEFNFSHVKKKIYPLNMLGWMQARRRAWNEQIYVVHSFSHPLYCVNIHPNL